MYLFHFLLTNVNIGLAFGLNLSIEREHVFISHFTQCCSKIK